MTASMSSGQTSATAMQRPAGEGLRVGDVIRDNDPRMYNGNRWLRVARITDKYVWADQGGNRCWSVRILKRRIYTDGKTRRTGFSLIDGPTP